MKEYILKNKKCLVNHVIALGILLVGFILGRYVFFDVHGMKEFPVVLLVLGLVVMVISVLTTKKILPYFISVGYIIGFVFGFIFQVTKMDANGVSVNNLWVIWAVVYVAFIVLGFICEWCFRKYGSSVDWKKNKSTKIIIAILGIVILWLCVGIVDFALVHNYRRPLFCVCTESMQDGGSGKYVGLGYSFDIEGNFMPEAKNPGVTSYRGYILGKEVCRGFWEKMDVDKLIYGDMSVEEEIGITQSDVRIELNSIAFSELAPGQEETYSSEYYVMMDDAWFDYTITYERAAMNVVVGLRAEDGTEYSEEVTGGAEVGTIRGIPAGTYEVFVRNSESNNNYKDTTTETLNVTGAMKFVAGQCLLESTQYSHSSITQGTSESITVEYIGAGQIKKWSVSPELIDDVMEWYADLDYKKVTFKDGESPADGEGQTVYDIEFSDGTSFYYYDCGQEGYIRMDGTWYEVKNPKLPPVGEPV